MDYYRILNLEQEPFSNSPDPELFFNSKQHLEALQMLEISIRLKRGLNVVTGNVGTGKTTISRQLVKRISDDPELNYFLVLDPGFKTVADFLGYLLNLFTGETALAKEDENSIKERIKNYLFTQGVDRKLTTVLIIDEGQKLPVFCLEALRELLNYETNAHKLLQIVIFAQKELDGIIAGLDNFKDRINFSYSLGPLNFHETREMIQYRLDRAAAPGTKGGIFSSLAYLSVYRFTQGYPRKIVKLCHHIILDLIIQNRSMAGWFFVRHCGFKVFPEKKVSLGHGSLATGIFLVALVLLGCSLAPGRFLSMIGEFEEDAVPVHAGVEPVARGYLYQIPPGPVTDDSVTEAVMPKHYGSLKVPKDVALYRMAETVYGSFNRQILKSLMSANPRIKNPDNIMAGMRIKFPVMDTENCGWKQDAVCIVFSKNPDFNRAYDEARLYKTENVDVRMLPVWSNDLGFLFLVVVDRPFKTMASAKAFKHQIPTPLAAQCTRLELAGSSETTDKRILF